jgi:glycerol uptake facilitator-like aquaporin
LPRPPLARALAAKAIGTTLVFAGAAAIMVDAKTYAPGPVGTACTFGLARMVMIYAVGQSDQTQSPVASLARQTRATAAARLRGCRNPVVRGGA